MSVSSSSGPARDPFLVVRGLKKSFGHVTALAGVDFELSAGEVVALCGDNGAGKSTLVSMLAGVQEPDDGTIEIDGRRVFLTSPLRAQEFGIATVFQSLALIEQRDVASNMFLGQEPVRYGLVVDRRRMRREATDVIARLRVGLPSVRTVVRDLSGGQRQAVAVARAVLRGSRILLLDEPTAALGVRESRRVVELIKELRAEGQAVVVISHNMEDVFEVADRIVVFRLGRKVADESRADLARDDLVSLLVHGRRTGAEA
ncbi:MAG TPA: ATP-binding cassette domain-containing protein [Conexibacter sp.]|jgi:D-xylose transport system ATP-binding protein|nr:ATP-binding cassette domain-containing protein [Conexibacter sp.]